MPYTIEELEQVNKNTRCFHPAHAFGCLGWLGAPNFSSMGVLAKARGKFPSFIDFKIMRADYLKAKTDLGMTEEEYDDKLAALVGDLLEMFGFSKIEDYFNALSNEGSDVLKRLMRRDMISQALSSRRANTININVGDISNLRPGSMMMSDGKPVGVVEEILKDGIVKVLINGVTLTPGGGFVDAELGRARVLKQQYDVVNLDSMSNIPIGQPIYGATDSIRRSSNIGVERPYIRSDYFGAGMKEESPELKKSLVSLVQTKSKRRIILPK